MQILKTPIEAVYDLTSSEQKLEDILNPVSKWGLDRELIPNEYIHAQYFDFLANLKISPLDPEYSKRIEDQKVKISETAKNVEIEQKKCDDKYQLYINMGLKPQKQQFIASYCSALNRAINDATQAEGILRMLISSTPDQDIRNAQIKMQKAVQLGEFPWKESFSALKTFRDRIEKRQTSSFRININKSNLKNEETSVEYSIVDNKETFISNSNGKSFSFKSSSDKFSMDIRALGYYSVSVSPADWYSQNVIDNHKNGPFIDKTFASEFFGKNKKLSLIPSTIYLLYKPEVVLQVGSEDLDFFKTSTVVHIGPFFGKVVKIESDPEAKVSGSSSLHSVVIRDARDHPLIVAIDNKTL